jgi:hypothetical protein
MDLFREHKDNLFVLIRKSLQGLFLFDYSLEFCYLRKPIMFNPLFLIHS